MPAVHGAKPKWTRLQCTNRSRGGAGGAGGGPESDEPPEVCFVHFAPLLCCVVCTRSCAPPAAHEHAEPGIKRRGDLKFTNSTGNPTYNCSTKFQAGLIHEVTTERVQPNGALTKTHTTTKAETESHHNLLPGGLHPRGDRGAGATVRRLCAPGRLPQVRPRARAAGARHAAGC